MDSLKDAKTEQECIDMATADCHDHDEATSGWCCCLDEVFSGVKEVKVFGEIMKFKGFNQAGLHAVVAVCEKDKKIAKVTLDSLELIDPENSQKLWIEAWIKWAGD